MLGILAALASAACPGTSDVTVYDNAEHMVTAHIYTGCSEIIRAVISEGITFLGYSAFYNCKSLSDVQLPSTLQVISGDAFSGCSSLTSITLPDALEDLQTSCLRGTSITTLEFPLSLRLIGEIVFQENNKLTRISFKNSASQNDHFIIENNACLYSSQHRDLIAVINSVTTIEIHRETFRIRGHALCFCTLITDENLDIPDSVGVINPRIVFSCGFKTITLGAGVSDITSQAFECAMELTDIYVSFSNNYYESFNGVLYTKGLKKLVIYPEGKTDEGFVVPAPTEEFEVGSFTRVCSSSMLTGFGTESDSVLVAINHVLYTKDVSTLVRVAPMYPGILDIDARVKTINKGALYSCGALKGINIPRGVLHIEWYAFGLCGLTTITLPDTLEVIGNQTFESSYLTSLTIPGSVKVIPFRMCCTCQYLESVILEEGVTTIIKSAFAVGSALKSITLPESIVVIGDNSLSQCVFTSIKLPSKQLSLIGERAFAVCQHLKSIRIPFCVELIDIEAFAECVSLKTVIIENCATRVAPSAFYLANPDTPYCLHTLHFAVKYDITNKFVFRGGFFAYLLFDLI